MSYQETRRGKLKKIIHVDGITNLDGMILELVRQLNIEKEYEEALADFEDEATAFLEATFDIESPSYAIINDDLYEILDNEELEHGFCNISHNKDGTLDFIASWHNGGASLEEVLADELSKKSLDNR
jgi:hypothetical protein